ncbi:TorF family putative porin [Flavobacterium sp.]|uniref:TorF family putative porin n=1 Tax=Flavobacterium sp. TaxID=239 RepID=UPI0037529E68
MKKKILFIVNLLCFSFGCFSQENKWTIDTISKEKEKKWEASLDVLSRYIWRGQSYGGNNITVQPSLNYAINKKLTFGFWASTNFLKNYYFPDGSTTNSYQEIDLSLTYKINKYLNIQVYDYYWPSVDKVEGVNNKYFNYGNDSVQTIDANLLFDFSSIWKPLKATISTLLAGNDFKFDSNGSNPKQNFTTYVELSYSFENIFEKVSKKTFQNINIEPVIGMVLNNQAQYYSAGDYNKPSFVNFGIIATRDLDLNKHFSCPIYLNYIHNASMENTEQFGRNFVILGTKFNYQ